MHAFRNKVAVITGAGSGIGRALALELATRGCHLSLADVSSEGLEQTRAGLVGADVALSYHLADVADREQVGKLARDTVQAHGGVDLLFNNAGVALTDLAEHVSEDDFRWLMEINFWGVVHGCQQFLPYLRERPEPCIVNISSVFGLIAMPTQGAYNASKFAVRGYSEALQQELAGTPVRVCVVCPGGVRTRIAGNARVADRPGVLPARGEFEKLFQRMARTSPQQAAVTILEGVAKRRKRILVGPDARLIQWVVRLFPQSYDRVLARLMPVPGVNC